MAGKIDDSEQQIADFARGGAGVARLDFRLDLVELLTQFGEDGARLRPVEPNLAGLFLQLEGAGQRRQGERDAGKDASGALTTVARALLRLDLTPERLDLVGRKIARVPENMGMPTDQLGGDRLDHVAEFEAALVSRHTGVEDDLQQEIAEFVAQICEIAALDRVGDFIGFLEREGDDRGEGLFEVPRTAGPTGPERRHDFDQAPNFARRLHFKKSSAARTRALGGTTAPDRSSSHSESAIASRPLGVSTTRMFTCWPSARCEMPAGPSTEMCTNTSLPPSSLATKPKPLASSNHFTRPLMDTAVEGSGATRRGRGLSPPACGRCGRSTTPVASTSTTRVTCAPLAPAPTITRNLAPEGTVSGPAAGKALACRNASPWPPASSTNP